MSAKRSQVMSIIKAYSGQNNTIAIPRVYIELTGDYNRAAILNQILYWSERTTDKNGWFYKTYEQWEEELGLSKYQVKRAIEGDKRSKDNSQTLINIGIETTVRKAPNGAPTVHYRVNEEVFIKHLTAAIDSLNQKQNPKVNNVDIPKVNNVENEQSTMLTMDSKQCSLSLYTETTTETTTNTIADEPQAAQDTAKDAPQEKTEKSSRNDWYDAVHDVLGVNGGLNGLYQQMLQGKATRKGYKEFNLEQSITPEQFREWGRWYRKTVLNDNPELSMVRDTAKIQSSIMDWLNKKSTPARKGDSFFQRKMPTNIDMITILDDKAVS